MPWGHRNHARSLRIENLVTVAFRCASEVPPIQPGGPGDRLQPREAGDGTVLEAFAHKNEPLKKRERTLHRLLLGSAESDPSKRPERRDNAGFREPQHASDLGREVERAVFLGELREPVEVHDFEGRMELRREEIARGGFLLDREAGIGDELALSRSDRDREPPLQEPLRAVPRAEAFDGFDASVPRAARLSWCGSRVFKVKVRGGFSVGSVSFAAGGASSGAAPVSAGAAGDSARGFSFATSPSSNQASSFRAAVAYAHLLSLRNEIQDVPALLAPEAIPGVLHEIHLELAPG